jgi:hypothetical protein
MAHSTRSYSILINLAAIFNFAITFLVFVLGVWRVYSFLQNLGNSENILFIVPVSLGLVAFLNLILFSWLLFRKFKSWLMPKEGLPGILEFILFFSFFPIAAPYVVVRYGWQLGIKLQEKPQSIGAWLR